MDAWPRTLADRPPPVRTASATASRRRRRRPVAKRDVSHGNLGVAPNPTCLYGHCRPVPPCKRILSLLVGSASVALAQSHMFRVDYIATKTLGATVVEREVGVHTFSPEGHYRVDREIAGERSTEMLIPESTEVEAERIEINHSLGTVRRGPARLMSGTPLRLEMPLSSMRRSLAGQGRSRVPSAETERVLREGFREQYLGDLGHGPLILRHYRVEFPHGLTRDSWRYRIAGQEITLALLVRGTMPDGTPAVQDGAPPVFLDTD